MTHLRFSQSFPLYLLEGGVSPFNGPMRVFILGKFSSVEMNPVFAIDVLEEGKTTGRTEK